MTAGSHQARIPPPLAEAAAAWDRRLRSADCSEADRRDFDAWCAEDPTHAAAFDNLQLGIRSLKDAYNDNPRLRAMRDSARTIKPAFQPWKIAAGLLVVVLGGGAAGWIITRPSGPVPPPQMEASRDAVSVYQTAVGERTTVVLSDGSKVTLNTRSKLVVGYTPGRRDVTLVSGQAMFEVAKNANRPFVVTAGSRKVTAVGTAFDVKVDARKVDVTLIEGKVRVDPSRPNLIQQIRPDVQRLTPGEQLIASSTTGDVFVRAADVATVTSWRQGAVVFNDTPLSEAVAEINRYAPDPIVVGDPNLAQYRVNGRFRTSEPATFVNALVAYFPVEARTSADGQTVLVAKR